MGPKPIKEPALTKAELENAAAIPIHVGDIVRHRGSFMAVTNVSPIVLNPSWDYPDIFAAALSDKFTIPRRQEC